MYTFPHLYASVTRHNKLQCWNVQYLNCACVWRTKRRHVSIISPDWTEVLGSYKTLKLKHCGKSTAIKEKRPTQTVRASRQN